MHNQTYFSVKDSDVEKYWNLYFNTERLFNNYALMCEIEDGIRASGAEVKVIIFFEKEGEVIGILPICNDRLWTYYPSLIFVAGPISIDPSCWRYLPEILPRPFSLQESSWKDSSPSDCSWITATPSNVINISSSTIDEYLSSLSKKHRSKLRNCLNRNLDIMVVAEALTDEDDFLALKNSYQTYCKERYNDVFFNRQMKLFPIVFEKAAEMGKLITLKCYLEEKLVAVNYSIIEGDTVYDYICYRNPVLSDRSLGIFAILENIKHVQKRYPDCKYYDLASEFDYKRKFVNCEKYHTVFNLK